MNIQEWQAAQAVAYAARWCAMKSHYARMRERYEASALAKDIGTTVLPESGGMTVSQILGPSGCLRIAAALEFVGYVAVDQIEDVLLAAQNRG